MAWGYPRRGAITKDPLSEEKKPNMCNLELARLNTDDAQHTFQIVLFGKALVTFKCRDEKEYKEWVKVLERARSKQVSVPTHLDGTLNVSVVSIKGYSFLTKPILTLEVERDQRHTQSPPTKSGDFYNFANANFEYEVTSRAATLNVLLFEKNVSTSNLVAKAEIPLFEFRNGREVSQEFELASLSAKKKGDAPGTIRLKIKFFLQEYVFSTNAMEIYGVPLELILAREKAKVPSLVVSCVTTLRKRALKTEGLFRLAGGKQKVASLRTSIDQGKPVDFDSIGENDVGDLLKAYLRELPEPLFTFALFEEFAKAVQVPPEQRGEQLKGVVHKLPQAHLDLLRYLFDFFLEVTSHSQFNKMTNENIGICFNPNLFRPPNDDLSAAMAITGIPNVTQMILDHYATIFPEDAQ